MKRISTIIIGIGMLIMMFGDGCLCSQGNGMYIALAISFAGIVLMGIGLLVAMAAQAKEERNRRRMREVKSRRDSVFWHWHDDCRLVDVDECRIGYGRQ